MEWTVNPVGWQVVWCFFTVEKIRLQVKPLYMETKKWKCEYHPSVWKYCTYLYLFGTGSDFSLLECFTLHLCYPLCFYYAVNMLEQLDSAIHVLSYNTLLGLSRQSSIPFELHVFKTRLPKATLKSLYTSVYMKFVQPRCVFRSSLNFIMVSVFYFLAISWYRIFKVYFKAKYLHPDRLKYCIQ